MARLVVLYFKYQALYLLFLLLVFTLPYALFLHFSHFDLPNVQYILLAVLAMSQYFFHRERDYTKKVERKVRVDLSKELSRVPSTKEIYARTRRVTRLRGTSVLLTAVSIVAVMIYFQDF